VTISPAPLQSRTRRPKRRSTIVGWAVRIVILLLVFAIGIVVGQALEDQPSPREPVTNITTIRPWTQTQAQR
jgi:hypothetical protein